MNIGVAEAAERIGRSERRVRDLIASGRLPAERIGSNWILDDADVAAFEPRLGRPMSEKNAWGLIDILDGREPDGLSAAEISRLRRRRNELVHVAKAEPGQAAPVLRSWLVRRADRCLFRASPIDLPDIRSDSELVASGVSDPRSGISAAGVVEGYVFSALLEGFVRHHLLVVADEASANVVLHVSNREVGEVPLLLLAADLAEYNSARENKRVDELLQALA